MTTHHTFYEFHDLEPGVKTIDALTAAIASDKQTAFVFGGELVRFVRGLLKMQPVFQLKNCRFVFEDGKKFVEVDSKGKVKELEGIPEWFQNPGEFARGQWLINHKFDQLMTTEFIQAFIDRFPDVKKRREHANLLFDLQLNKVAGAITEQAPVKRLGNTTGKTTKSKVTDLNSFELFSQFFDRLKMAVTADQFPTLQILTGNDDLAKTPNHLKQGVRTWFKAIAGDLPPNNKRVGAGNAELFCAPIREQLQQIEAIGLEKYYQALSKAINHSDEKYISDFSFTYQNDN